MPTVSSTGVQPSHFDKEEESAWLPVAIVLGLLGAALGAACAFLVGMAIGFGESSERLEDVINVVALGCFVASIVCAVQMARPRWASLQLAVHLST